MHVNFKDKERILQSSRKESTTVVRWEIPVVLRQAQQQTNKQIKGGGAEPTKI